MVAATIGRAKSKRVATKQIFLKIFIDIIKVLLFYRIIRIIISIKTFLLNSEFVPPKIFGAKVYTFWRLKCIV